MELSNLEKTDRIYVIFTLKMCSRKATALYQVAVNPLHASIQVIHKLSTFLITESSLLLIITLTSMSASILERSAIFMDI